ncbi:MAG: hypothetical protein PHX80_04255 [Candidatus Nanoarchaeia archaeon]|nr:hypothetical protein [Candidatus Nanoarchaeia archaeon]
MNENVVERTIGWRCPLCGRVYSPDVRECESCNQQPIKWIPYPVYPYPSYPWGVYPYPVITCTDTNDGHYKFTYPNNCTTTIYNTYSGEKKD